MKKLYWKGRLMAPLLDNLARVLLLYLVVIVFDLIIVLFICHGRALSTAICGDEVR